MSKVLFAGTFNPYTIGHHSVYNNACEIFPHVEIGIAQNQAKGDQNPHVIKWVTNPAFSGFSSMNVKIVDEPMLADFAVKNGYKALVRSLRNSIDLVNEIDLATWNKSVGNMNTVFVPSDTGLDHISSSAIRNIDALGKDMSAYFVNDIQYKRWKNGKPRRIIVTGTIGSGKSSFIDNELGEYSRYVDMDVVVKERLGKESAKLMTRFFEDTPVSDIKEDWALMSDTVPYQEVIDIISDTINFHDRQGFTRSTIHEISAFTAYDLEKYYEDSIIVYVDNYDSGKQRTIDPTFMSKVKQLQDIPKVVDFVVNQKAGNVEKVVKSIIETMGTEWN